MIELGTTWSYSSEPPNEIVVSTFTALFYVLSPLIPLAGYIDSEVFRIEDDWYYVSAIAGAFVWASIILWVFRRSRKIKSQPVSIVNDEAAPHRD
jgi:hypothetical protein